MIAVKWIVIVYSAIWGIAMFCVGNPISGVFSILFAVALSPALKLILSKLNIKISKKVIFLAVFVLFLTSFVSSVLLTDTSKLLDNEESDVDNQEASQELQAEETVDDSVSISEVNENPEETTSEIMKVHFIDVGQGDSTLIEYQNEYMLIDAGPDSTGTRLQKYLYDNNVSKIKYLILTHPDADHIGGADVVVTKFDIEKIYMSSYIADSDDYMHLIEAIGSKGYSWEIPRKGDVFSLGDVDITVIQSKEYADSNNSSICLRVEYGEESFLFTGDIEEEAENDIIMSGVNLESDVYQVGHHGSYTSSSQQFLNAMNPLYAVISCGKENVYNHPHQETNDKLREMNVFMFRTDLQGTIIALTDGNGIEWSIDPSTKYDGGSSEYERECRNSLNAQENEQSLEDIGEDSEIQDEDSIAENIAYIGNKKNMKLHKASCTGTFPKESNREYFYSLEEAEMAGYKKEDQCQICMPFD